jgi:hypothetical protein
MLPLSSLDFLPLERFFPEVRDILDASLFSFSVSILASDE